MDCETIINKIESITNDKLAKTSKEQYKRQFAKLCREMGKDDETFQVSNIFKDADRTNKWIIKQYPVINQRKALIGAVLAVIKYFPTYLNLNKKEEKAWKVIGADIRKETRSHQLNQELSDKQKENWVEWTDVVSKREVLAKNEYGSKRHLLLAMYSLIPPMRNDYDRVKIYGSLKEVLADVGTKGKKHMNYLILKPKRATIYINKYKTQATYGKHQAELPLELAKIIRANQLKMKAEDKPRYLFTNTDDNAFPDDEARSFTTWACRVFKDLFDKSVNITILRHSYLSSKDFLAKTLEERVRIAKECMKHSYLIQQSYIALEQVENGKGESSEPSEPSETSE